MTHNFNEIVFLALMWATIFLAVSSWLVSSIVFKFKHPKSSPFPSSKRFPAIPALWTCAYILGALTFTNAVPIGIPYIHILLLPLFVASCGASVILAAKLPWGTKE